MKYNPQRIITEWLQYAFQLKLRVVMPDAKLEIIEYFWAVGRGGGE